MLTAQVARQVVLSTLASTSSSLGKLQLQVDAAYQLMHRRDEPLSSIASYFERHSETDWSPVRRLTGRFVGRCLRSRLVCSFSFSHLLRVLCNGLHMKAICLFTNVAFVDATPSTPFSPGHLDSIILSGQVNADCEDEADDNDLFFESSKVFELDDCYAACSSESRSLSVSSPTLPSTPLGESPRLDLLSRRLRRRQSPTFDSLYDDSADEGEDENDEKEEGEPIMAPTSFFVPINDGCGLSHVIVGQDASPTQPLEEISNDSSRNTSSTTDLFAGSTDTGVSSPNMETSKGRIEEINKLLEDNMQLEEENFLLNVQMAQLERKNGDLNVALEEQNRLIKRLMDTETVLEQKNEALQLQLAQRDLADSHEHDHLKGLVHAEEREDVKEEDEGKAGKDNNGEINELLEENMRLEEEKFLLNVQMSKLECKNVDLNVAVKEQNGSIKHHMDTNKALEQEKDALKTKLAQWHSAVSREINHLEGLVLDLENANDGLESRIETLTEEVTDRDIKVGNFIKAFERYKVEWKDAAEKTEELRQVIQAYPNHSGVLIKAITKRDEQIARLKQLVKKDRVCDTAMRRAYAKFAAKYNDVVGLANVRLEVGVLLSQRLAEAEAYLLQEGHASPISDREGVWEDAYNAFRINENGLGDQNEDGDYLMFTPEMEIAETPDGWLPGLLKKIWIEEGEVEEGGNEAGSQARRITWLGDGEDAIFEAEDGNCEDGDETQHSNGDDAVEAFLNTIGVDNNGFQQEAIDPDSALNTDQLLDAEAATAESGKEVSHVENINTESNPDAFNPSELTPIIKKEATLTTNTAQTIDANSPPPISSNHPDNPSSSNTAINNDDQKGESDPTTNASNPFSRPAPAPAPTTGPLPPPCSSKFRQPTTTTQNPSPRPTIPPRTGSSATQKRNAQRKKAMQRLRETLRQKEDGMRVGRGE